MESTENLLCPSYVCKVGSSLYGIVNKNGFVDYLQATLTVDDTFIQIAQQGREPEKRFRFAGTCVKSGCKHWEHTEKACSLIDTVIEVIGNQPVTDLQPCPIRAKCRWFAQRNATACAQCSEIIRNIETKVLNL